MPIQYTLSINGVEQRTKWACESCINGHRSSKCDHFGQWMLQVATPGRPKVKCPHPAPPCTCKTKEKYLMVLVGKNAKGECICEPWKAGQSQEESTFMVPPVVRDPHLHQGPQMGVNHGQNLYGGFPSNGEISVGESASGSNNMGLPTTYQNFAPGDFPLQAHPPQRPSQISSQAAFPQAYPQQYSPWNPTQGYLPKGLPQGSAQVVHPSWSSTSEYHQFPPAPMDYGAPTTAPLGGNHTHQHVEPTPLPTPEQTPPPLPHGSGYSHPQFSPGEHSSAWGYRSYPPQVSQPHTSGDQQDIPYQHGGAYNDHGPVHRDDFIANDIRQPHDSLEFNPDASIDVFNSFTNAQQQEKHVTPLAFHDVESSGQSIPSYDFANISEGDYDPKPANTQHSHQPSGMHPNTCISKGMCQCGDACNCMRCATHPENPATTEWLWGLNDKMVEEVNGGSAPTSRPQSSYGQPSSALNTSSQDLASEAQGFNLGFAQTSPLIWNDYSVLKLPITGCSNNAHCLCGENCRCEGCLTHSGHVKL